MKQKMGIRIRNHRDLVRMIGRLVRVGEGVTYARGTQRMVHDREIGLVINARWYIDVSGEPAAVLTVAHARSVEEYHPCELDLVEESHV